MAVAYWTLPKGIAILISFTPESVQNLIDLPQYLDFVIRTMLVFGVAFLIPLVVVLLNMVGIVPASVLSKFRPYIILVIFVFAAVATPSGDPFTMCLLAMPMCLLFFVAEVIAGSTTSAARARPRNCWPTDEPHGSRWWSTPPAAGASAPGSRPSSGQRLRAAGLSVTSTRRPAPRTSAGSPPR